MFRRSVIALLVTGGVALAQLPPPPSGGAEGEVKRPRLVAAQRTLDLGKVYEGDKPIISWLIENHGQADLIIENTKSGCGCTVVKLEEDERVIPPGGHLELKAEFDSTGRRGRQHKVVTVFSNDSADPQLQLEFEADVETLYEIRPQSVLQLKLLRRGEVAPSGIEIYPSDPSRPVEILGVKVEGNAPFTWKIEPFSSRVGEGQIIRFTAATDAAMGPVLAEAAVQLKIGDIERVRQITLRGEIVGDLTFNPKVLDMTRQTMRHGQELAPVRIMSPDKVPFSILGASGGALLDVTVEPATTGRQTEYIITARVREDAAPGPFGATIDVQTDAVDQPLVQIPVYGNISPEVSIEPPIVLFRQDGTDVGQKRRLKLMCSPLEALEVRNITCSNGGVRAEVDQEASSRYQHLRYVQLEWEGKLPTGTHAATLTLETNRPGAERLEIPVTVTVP